MITEPRSSKFKPYAHCTNCARRPRVSTMDAMTLDNRALARLAACLRNYSHPVELRNEVAQQAVRRIDAWLELA